MHTHLCYCEFGEVVEAIDGLGADVTTVEAARSNMEVVAALGAGTGRDIGPGVYDVHSPEVPSVAEIAGLLRTARRAVPLERLWANPGCGLKTRGDAEVVAAFAQPGQCRPGGSGAAGVAGRRRGGGVAGWRGGGWDIQPNQYVRSVNRRPGG